MDDELNKSYILSAEQSALTASLVMPAENYSVHSSLNSKDVKYYSV